MKIKLLAILPLFTLVFVLVQACGDDDDDTSGKGGKSGGSAGKGGAAAKTEKGSNIVFGDDCSGDPPFKKQTCVNIYCPDFNGTPSMNEAGDCCKRMDLAKANQDKASEKKVYEYRFMTYKTLTLPTTAGAAVVTNSTANRLDKKAIISLFRITGDLEKEGEVTYEQGPGIYNCDGTYSFYAEGAASAVPYTTTWSTDPDRFVSVVTKGTWYPDDGRIDVALTDLRKGVTGQPVYDNDKADFPAASEFPTQAHAMLKLPLKPDNLDCAGSRSETAWTTPGVYEAYYSVKNLDKSTNNLGLANQAQSSCQFYAFFSLDPGQEKNITCNMERCDISTNPSCRWRELPDALCPDNADEEAIFPCHLGDQKKAAEYMKACEEKNYSSLAPKQWCETLKKWPSPPCSKTPPTSIEDTPQCCDPLAQNTDGLPACNAWRIVYEFAAASVEITDKPTTTLQKSCQ